MFLPTYAFKSAKTVFCSSLVFASRGATTHDREFPIRTAESWLEAIPPGAASAAGSPVAGLCAVCTARKTAPPRHRRRPRYPARRVPGRCRAPWPAASSTASAPLRIDLLGLVAKVQAVSFSSATSLGRDRNNSAAGLSALRIPPAGTRRCRGSSERRHSQV